MIIHVITVTNHTDKTTSTSNKFKNVKPGITPKK